MNKRTAVAVLHCVVIFLAGTFSVFGQAKQRGLRETGITIKMESQPVGVVFKYLMEKYDIPIAFEESTLDRNFPDYDFYVNLPASPQRKIRTRDGKIKVVTMRGGRVFKALIHLITLDAENKRLKEVFDDIIFQMENYKWEINDGVVNIYPVKGRDERFEKLLGTKIKNYTFVKGDTTYDVMKYITLLPEFVTSLAENRLVFKMTNLELRFGYRFKIGRPINQDMNFSNLTFRELLNKITSIKRGGWVLKWGAKADKQGWDVIEFDI
jgi:hypothetical protein